MKLLLCLNHDVFSLVSLNLLLPYLAAHNIAFSIVMTQGVGQAAASDITKVEKIIPLEGILPTLDALAITGRFLSLSRIIQQYKCGFTFVSTINNDFGLQQIAAHDVVVSIRFGSIFKQPAIDQARHPIINLHSAILPDYKGILGTFRALHDKNTTIGATIHTITDATIDTGDIIQVIKLPADYNTTLFGNLLRLYQQAVPSLADVIVQVFAQAAGGNKIRKQPQNTNAGRYFSNPTPSEIDHFKHNIMPIYNNEDIKSIVSLFGR